MPNWANNHLTVLGSPERVSEFVMQANGATQTYQPSAYDLHFWKHERDAALKEGTDPPPDPYDRIPEQSVLSFHRLRPIPDDVMAQEYDPAGYEAEQALWGVKWGASD